MRSAIRCVLVILSAVMFSGCIEVESTVIVKKDGSGFIVESMCFTPQAQQMMEGMKGMAEGMGGDANAVQSDPMKPSQDDLNKRAAELGETVKFVSTKEKTTASGAKGYTATYSFTDVTKIKVSLENNIGDKQAGGPAGGPDGKKKEQPPITFGFTPGATAKLTINLPREEKDPNTPPPEITPEMKQQMAMSMGMMGSMLKGMRMRLMVKVEGEITSTTAKTVIKSKSSDKKQFVMLYDIDFDKIMTNQDLFSELMLAEQTGGNKKALEKKLDAMEGISIETADTVTISFK